MTLDFIGYMVLIAVVAITIAAITKALDVSVSARHAIAAIAGIWTGLQLALYEIGAFQAPINLEAPLIGVMVATPLVIVGIAAAASERVRATLLALPMPLMIGLNSMRIFGGFFLLLAAAGRLGGPFPYSAGWGDVITSVLAVPLAIAVARGSASPSTTWWWNLFGAVDLVAAITFGTLSSNGSVYQIIFAGEGSAAVQHMPWLLIPTVLVPFWLIVHGIIFAQLRQRRATTVAA
jgi:hypothetical protein